MFVDANAETEVSRQHPCLFFLQDACIKLDYCDYPHYTTVDIKLDPHMFQVGSHYLILSE